MTDRYENIRRALEMGPTPGPWKAHDQSESGWVDITHSTYATPLCYAAPHSEPMDDPGHDCKLWVSRAHETPANAAHIAACDPDTIRALLEERDALQAENEWLRAERDALAAALEAAREDACVALVADIRFACGDKGKRSQPELVEYIRGLARDAERYRWLREKGFTHADVELGEDEDGEHWVTFRPYFKIPEPSGWPLYDADESSEWSLGQIDEAIDAAMQRTSGGDHE